MKEEIMLKELENEIKRLCPEIMEREVLFRANRDWSAWSYGTMTESDFEEVDLSEYLTLEDVLKALEKKRKPLEFKLDVDTKGYMTLFYYKWGAKDQVNWEFGKPLHLQKPEVIEFLSNLILNK